MVSMEYNILSSEIVPCYYFDNQCVEAEYTPFDDDKRFRNISESKRLIIWFEQRYNESA